MIFLATVMLATQLDACHVLLPEDVAAVQGEAFTDAKLSKRDGSTTCFYQLPSFSKSVSVDLMRRGGREYWEKNFENEREERDHERKREEGEKEQPRVKVRGVGSEALWVPSRVSGSLYVRKGDSLIRVSVGGPGTDEEKIARSKALALKALKRL